MSLLFVLVQGQRSGERLSIVACLRLHGVVPVTHGKRFVMSVYIFDYMLSNRLVAVQSCLSPPSYLIHATDVV